MAKATPLQGRIAAGILDTASDVLAEHGSTASMAEIAEAAGVGRATLYRYFPTREALVRGLIRQAVDDLDARISAAELDTVAVREGIARLARSFVSAGLKYAALARMGEKNVDDADELDQKLAEPVRALLRRGIADGTLRSDLQLSVQFEMFTGLLEKALHLVAGKQVGVEQASTAIITVFLDGVARSDSNVPMG